MGKKDRRQASHMVKASKVAIVTGAGSGIGKAAALALLRDGWSVVLAGRRESLLQEVVGEEADMFAHVGRNALCPCGSGRKFKKCHGAPGRRP